MADPSAELWAPVVGYEGIYEVSDHGRVRSYSRVGVNGSEPRVLKPGVTKGYSRVTLTDSERRKKMHSVHRLVLSAFVGPCPEGMEACHGDGTRANNFLANLRWDTRSANGLDIVRHGNHNSARKTKCKRGHEFAGGNLMQVATGRSCRACWYEASQAKANSRAFSAAEADRHFARYMTVGVRVLPRRKPLA